MRLGGPHGSYVGCAEGHRKGGHSAAWRTIDPRIAIPPSGGVPAALDVPTPTVGDSVVGVLASDAEVVPD